MKINSQFEWLLEPEKIVIKEEERAVFKRIHDYFEDHISEWIDNPPPRTPGRVYAKLSGLCRDAFKDGAELELRYSAPDQDWLRAIQFRIYSTIRDKTVLTITLSEKSRERLIGAQSFSL